MDTVTELSPRRAARKLLKRRWRVLQTRARHVSDSASAEQLHDFRVALRKLRAVLAFAEREQGLSVGKSRKSALKELAAASGALRDWEITREQITKLWTACELPDSWLAHECAILLNVAQRRASRDFARIMREHKSLLKHKLRVRRRKHGDSGALTLREALGRHMLHLIGDVEDSGLSPLMLPEELHGLRIAAKNLRYTLESVKDDSAEPLLRELRLVQDQLGAIHDIDHTCDVLRRWHQQIVRGGPLGAGDAFARMLDEVGRERAERIDDWKQEFPANGAELVSRLQVRARAVAGLDSAAE